MVTGYKTEKLQGSSLIRSTAIEAHASWDRLNAKLTTLETNITRYNDLVILLCKSSAEVTVTETKIDESIVQLDEYISKVAEVRTAEIVTFREIEDLLNPPPEIIPDNSSQRQGQQLGPSQQGSLSLLDPRLTSSPACFRETAH